MVNESFNNNIEKKESSFNVKKQLATLFAVLSTQLGIAQTKTIDTNTTTKSQTEVVQEEDPVKELMKKFNVNTLTDVEIMDLKDMVSMLKDIYTLTANNKQLESLFNDLTKKLELCIKAERTDFNFVALKTGVGTISISEEQKKLDIEIAKAKLENKNLKEQIETLTNKVEATQKVAQSLIKKE